VTVEVLAHFELKQGNEANEAFAAQFFSDGKALVDSQPTTTMWFAFRLGPNAYGAPSPPSRTRRTATRC
jgi:hypothetical protein